MKYTVIADGERKVTKDSSLDIAREAKKYAGAGHKIVYVEFDDENGDGGYYNPDGKHGDVPREWRKD